MAKHGFSRAALGRIGRGQFWWASLVLWAVALPLLDTLASHGPAWVASAFAAIALALLLCLSALRLHDRNRSAAWLLVALVPLLGPLWLLWQLGLRRGTPGPNAYGPDPLAPSHDHLKVA